MSQPTIWTDPAKFFREDQKLKYEAAQSDASRPNIYASGESSFEQWQSKLINDLSKKPTPEPTPVADEVDPEAAEAKNQEIVQALGAVRCIRREEPTLVAARNAGEACASRSSAGRPSCSKADAEMGAAAVSVRAPEPVGTSTSEMPQLRKPAKQLPDAVTW